MIIRRKLWTGIGMAAALVGGDSDRTYGSGKDLVDGRRLEVFRDKPGH